MTQGRAIRLLRGAGFAMGTIAAVVVFVVGARNGVQDWTVPALLLVGVLVFVVHVATLSVAMDGDQETTTRQIVEYEVVPQGLAAPSFEPTSVSSVPPAPGVVAATVPGLGAMVLQDPPPGAFPDAGNEHEKRFTVTDGGTPPPMHAVLAEDPVPAPASPTAAPGAPAAFAEDSDDSVYLDIRPQRDDEPMVQRMLHGEAPPEGTTADVSAPAVHPDHAAQSSAAQSSAASLPGPSGPRLSGPSAAPAPGWWVASDGNWYPPELHPDVTSGGQG